MNTPIDLTTQKYPINDLIWNIYDLDFLEVLRTQHLTEEFTVDYILNKDYQLTEIEKRITIKTVLKCQPHLNNDRLKYLIHVFDKKKRLYVFVLIDDGNEIRKRFTYIGAFPTVIIPTPEYTKVDNEGNLITVSSDIEYIRMPTSWDEVETRINFWKNI